MPAALTWDELHEQSLAREFSESLYFSGGMRGVSLSLLEEVKQG